MKVLQAAALSVLVLLSSACWRDRNNGCCGPRGAYTCPKECLQYAPDSPYPTATTEVVRTTAAPVVVEEELVDDLYDVEEME